MRLLGATPTSVPAPEVYTSLERGMINAAAFTFTTAHASYRLHEVAEWFTSNHNPGVINCPLVVNTQAQDSLPEENSTMLHDLKPGNNEARRQDYAQGDAEWLPSFR